VTTAVELIPSITPQRHALNRNRSDSSYGAIFDLLDVVKDPEIPVLSIWQLGILQDVKVADDVVNVVITPTYSGCPAVAWITQEIIDCLAAAGYARVAVDVQLSPAWTTDWLDGPARQALRDYGIAAPQQCQCPQCGSADVAVVSEFGSTACKALYRCRTCHEPFDYFKPL